SSATIPSQREGAGAGVKANQSRSQARNPNSNDARAKASRATAAAREILEENVRPQVEKLRRASSVVIEGASFDPSLRFVLVAGVLFVLFLLLLVLSKWIG